MYGPNNYYQMPPTYPPYYGPPMGGPSSPTPWSQDHPPSAAFKEAYKFWRKIERNGKKDEEEKKKKDGDKKKSVLTTVQWFIILSGTAPILAPLYIFAVVAAYQNAIHLIKATIN